jgi:UDP-N-acetylmuramate dehydrogenase
MKRTLADLTTLRVGGAIGAYVRAESEADVVDALRQAKAERREVFILGEGSNVVCSDDAFDGIVVHIANRGIVRTDDDHGTFVSVQAGEPWDDLVAWTIAEGLTGLEALSGIPGLTGATPVQNVGAYGQDVSAVLTAVVAWDRQRGETVHFTRADCDFDYRTSVFKRLPERWVIHEVTFQLKPGADSSVQYRELAEYLGCAVGDAVPAPQVREAVLALRRAKGMVLNPTDHDTWSVGSFFTNPIVGADIAARFPDDCPRYPATAAVKLSAAWLIQAAGIERGWGLVPEARISTKHVLALTNRGGATADDVLALAGAVRDRVREVHGITLHAEPRLIGCALGA